MSPITELDVSDVVQADGFEIVSGCTDPHGRVEIWVQAEHGHRYSIGADPAFGLPGRDYDAAVIADCSVDPVEQVGEVHGHWGPDKFDLLLFGLCRMFNGAFLVLEGQGGGITVARRLWDKYQYRALYRRRMEKKAGRETTAELGYWRTKGDDTLWNLRAAFSAGDFVLRSKVLIDQISRMEIYSPKDDDRFKGEDASTKIRLKGGGSPDLVRAAEYCWLGVSERGIQTAGLPDDGFTAIAKGRGVDTFGDAALMAKERRRDAALTRRLR